MVCKFCGNEIEDGSEFCFICGQKVEASDQPVNDVYSQPAEAPAPAVAVETPTVEAPVYRQPVVEPTAPVATAPVAAVPVPEQEVQTGKKAKKAKKPKTQYQTSKGIRFVAFLFAIIGYILYRKAKNSGNEVRATEILNAIMLGLDVKMAIVVVIMAKKWMLS